LQPTNACLSLADANHSFLHISAIAHADRAITSSRSQPLAVDIRKAFYPIADGLGRFAIVIERPTTHHVMEAHIGSHTECPGTGDLIKQPRQCIDGAGVLVKLSAVRSAVNRYFY